MALKFAPWGSEIELPFYTALSQLKIDHDKLDDSARTVLGLYEPRATAPEESCRMRVLGNALTSDEYEVLLKSQYTFNPAIAYHRTTSVPRVKSGM